MPITGRQKKLVGGRTGVKKIWLHPQAFQKFFLGVCQPTKAGGEGQFFWLIPSHLLERSFTGNPDMFGCPFSGAVFGSLS
jgi:hypothetical protein